MRVLIQADMEGISQVTDHHELLAWWPAFWRSGRAKMTAEAAAAAAGLRAGGATRVAVQDGHGSGAPNLLADRLPGDLPVLTGAAAAAQLRAGAFDAVFQLGRHARCGTNDGFVPHTQHPGLAVAVDGRLVTESHLNAWRAGLPVLGITGDDRLAPQLDGPLAGVPFLPVKHSRGRTATRPRYATADEAAAAIRAFAAECARGRRARPAPTLPPSFELAASFANPAAAARAAGQHGLTRTGRATVRVRAEGWWDAEPALRAAGQAAVRLMFPAFEGLDLSTEDAAARADPERLASVRHSLTAWLQQPDEAWWE
jgi:D-amino peptidase